MKAVGFSFFLSVALATLAQAGPILLVDRGLPSSADVNDSVGATNRSNVDWGNQDPFINGDDFTATGNWNVTDISVWMVGDPADFGAASFALYGGVSGGSTFGIISTSPTITQVWYQPPNAAANCNTTSGVNYQGSSSSTSCSPIYKLDFAVNLSLTTGTVYNFAPDATPNDPSTCDSNTSSFDGCFYVHATNAALAGTTQQGSDNQYINFDSTNTTNGDPLYIDSNGNGWDKSSDINVQVYGTVVPEPSTAALIIVGLGALLVRRRKR